MEKLIITAAICGAEVLKEHNPAVPYTVEECAREAKSAYDAGASIIHLHVRNDDGQPTQDKNRFKQVMDAIRAVCPDVIIQPSTGGAVGMTNDERLQPTELLPEMATLDCGTLNFGGDEIFENTENTIKYFGQKMIERGIKPELDVCRSLIAHLKNRKETRWHSFNENLDHPETDEKFYKYVNSKLENGEIKIIFRDIVKEDTYEHTN